MYPYLGHRRYRPIRQNSGPYRTQSHLTKSCSLWACVDQMLVYKPAGFPWHFKYITLRLVFTFSGEKMFAVLYVAYCYARPIHTKCLTILVVYNNDQNRPLDARTLAVFDTTTCSDWTPRRGFSGYDWPCIYVPTTSVNVSHPSHTTYIQASTLNTYRMQATLG